MARRRGCLTNTRSPVRRPRRPEPHHYRECRTAGSIGRFLWESYARTNASELPALGLSRLPNVLPEIKTFPRPSVATLPTSSSWEEPNCLVQRRLPAASYLPINASIAGIGATQAAGSNARKVNVAQTVGRNTIGSIESCGAKLPGPQEVSGRIVLADERVITATRVWCIQAARSLTYIKTLPIESAETSRLQSNSGVPSSCSTGECPLHRTWRETRLRTR